MSKIAESIIQSLQSVQDEILRIEGLASNIGEIDIDLTLDKLKEAYSSISNLKRDLNAHPRTENSTPEPAGEEINEAVQAEELNNEVTASTIETSKDQFSDPSENDRENTEEENIASAESNDMEQRESEEEIPVSLNMEEQKITADSADPDEQAETQEEIVQNQIPENDVIQEEVNDTDENLDSVYSNSDDQNITSTVYDKISSGTFSEDLASKLQKNPIHDLKEAIGLHKKYRFINELFDGNHEAYANAIHELNNAGGTDRGVSLLIDFKNKYGWPEEELFVELKELVVRRHGITG